MDMAIYVDVVTPGNGKTYEFRLDGAMTVGRAREQMIKEITEAEGGNIALDPGNAVLGDLDTRAVLRGPDTLPAAGVKSGHRLILL